MQSKKLRRKKAPGVDEIPVGILKELDEGTQRTVPDILKDWREREVVDDEYLKARVIMIVKERAALRI